MLPRNPSEFLEDKSPVMMCKHTNIMYERYYRAAREKNAQELRASIHKLSVAITSLERGHAKSGAIPTLIFSLVTLANAVIAGQLNVTGLLALEVNAKLALTFIIISTGIGALGILVGAGMFLFSGRWASKRIPAYLLYKLACEQCFADRTETSGPGAEIAEESAAETTETPAVPCGTS